MIYNTIYCLKTHAYKDVQHAQKYKHQIQGCSNIGGKEEGSLRQGHFKCIINVLLLKMGNE